MKLPENFNVEEINVHRAVQLLSLTGVNLIPPLPDDSQNTQVWDSESEMILGRTFTIDGKNYKMGIKLIPFGLSLLSENLQILQSIDIGGLDQPALYSIWADWIANLGLKKDLITTLHYELPENEHYKTNNFNGVTNEFSTAWTGLRTMANQAMSALNQLSGITSEINIWPHHFDTGVYYSITEANGESIQAIGGGLAIADSMIDEPYFYLYGWAKEGTIDYSSAPSNTSGQWLTEGWQGAVLRASDISNIEDTNAFFKEAYEFLFNQLKN